tara:strand:- start:256 stop:549 length:294 start_codon:yes stop_codon:yes gene_type:complete
MEFIKSKYFYFGILTGLLWTSFAVVMLLFVLSNESVENSLLSLYNQKKLGGLISISALINLPVFFIALKKNNFSFASGLVAICLILVMLIAFLKINN